MSRFGFFAVRSTLVTSASSQTTSAARSGSGGGPAAGENGSDAGRKSSAEVRARAREQQVLDLGVRLGAADRRVELDEHELGHGQPERAGELAGDDLRDERLRPLPGTAELEDVEAVVVGLDERGQRAALAERRHVAGRGDGAHSGRAVPHHGDHGIELAHAEQPARGDVDRDRPGERDAERHDLRPK